jgi:hypothetical protein
MSGNEPTTGHGNRFRRSLASIGAGWAAHDFAADRACRYVANGYGRFDADAHALPEYPLVNVSNDVVGEIQRCWAAHPYEGPQYVLELVDARKRSDGGYYLFFEPWGITDIQLVFSVDANRRVAGAYLRSTL